MRKFLVVSMLLLLSVSSYGQNWYTITQPFPSFEAGGMSTSVYNVSSNTGYSTIYVNSNPYSTNISVYSYEMPSLQTNTNSNFTNFQTFNVNPVPVQSQPIQVTYPVTIQRWSPY